MIVVVEGIDRVGKTTLIKKLEKVGFINLKDEFVINNTIHEFKDYSVGKCESFVKIAEQLDKQGYNIVFDRLHLTEFVYGEFNRGGNVNKEAVWMVDLMLSKLGAMLCYVKPTDILLSNKEAGTDQSKHSVYFDFAVQLSSMTKVICDYNTLDHAFDLICDSAFKYHFYFASPFFNPEQVEREERMIDHLRSLGFTVFSPKESCHLDAKASQQSREEVFNSNCDAIRSSMAVFAVTDGKDMGTIWEAGFAYGINKPIAYFAETLGNNQFNLMLAQSGVDVFTSQDEVTRGSLDNVLRGVKRSYKGDIE